jgi:hypothetical protein
MSRKIEKKITNIVTTIYITMLADFLEEMIYLKKNSKKNFED